MYSRASQATDSKKTTQIKCTNSDSQLWRTNNSIIFLLFVRRNSWYCVVILGRCSLFPSRVGLRTYQLPCIVAKVKELNVNLYVNLRYLSS